jgi:glutamate 5-kinase
LKYAKPARGTLLIDRGAARAVREGSASLLPVGVVGVEGEFDAGDAVQIALVEGDGAPPGRPIAKGICNYAAPELRRVMGMKSSDVLELLPRASEEAVHRDYLVLD